MIGHWGDVPLIFFFYMAKITALNWVFRFVERFPMQFSRSLLGFPSNGRSFQLSNKLPDSSEPTKVEFFKKWAASNFWVASRASCSMVSWDLQRCSSLENVKPPWDDGYTKCGVFFLWNLELARCIYTTWQDVNSMLHCWNDHTNLMGVVEGYPPKGFCCHR